MIVADLENFDICPICAAYRIIIRARRLGQQEHEPMGVYLIIQGDMKYLTVNTIATMLGKVAIDQFTLISPQTIFYDYWYIQVESGHKFCMTKQA